MKLKKVRCFLCKGLKVIEIKLNISIAVIGLGYVGLPLACAFSKKYKVIGFDIDSNRTSELNKYFDRTLELSATDLRQTLTSGTKLTSDVKDIVNCNIFIVTVPTPIDQQNQPNLKPLQTASAMLGKILKKDDIVVYESTVYPGCTEEECVPILEKESGLKFNLDFYCGYSPERINPGDKLHTVDKIIKVVAGSNTETKQTLVNLYGSIIAAGIHPASSIKVAEAAKVIENTQRDLNIAFINELSIIFNKMGIDTQEVLSAAGSKWNFLPFKPGLVGGHCIGVDPYYLTYKAKQLKMQPNLILAGRKLNNYMPKFCVENIIKLMLSKKIDVRKAKIAVFGITFKENCPDIRNSKVFDVLDNFKQWDIEVLLHDPLADADKVAKHTDYKLVKEQDIKGVNAIVFATPHRQYTQWSAEKVMSFSDPKQPLILADLKAIFDKDSFSQHKNTTIFRL